MQSTFKRYGQIVKLKPDRIREYEDLQAGASPLLQNRLSQEAYNTPYLKVEILDAYFEYIRKCFNTEIEKIAANPRIQKWYNVHKTCILSGKNGQEGERWAKIKVKEIFHQSYQSLKSVK